jgi:O-antigen ligase
LSPALLTLATVQGASGASEKVGAIVVALLAAGAVLGRRPLVGRRLGALLIVATVVLTPVLLVIDIWNTSVIHHVRDHAALALVGLVIGLAALAVLATIAHRRPQAFPLAAVFALPFRVPISSAGTTANLLVPLYVVIAAAALGHAVPRLLGRRTQARISRNDSQGSALTVSQLSSLASDSDITAAAGRGARSEAPARAGERERERGAWLRLIASRRTLEALLMGYVVLYAIQAAYSPDFSKGLQNLLFFYVPFALLFRLLLDVRWSPELLRRCFGVLVALAALFVAIGLVELAAKALLLNSSLVAKDVYGNYFRVNSLFYDPNIYGRFLALVMVLLATAVLFAARSRRDLLLLGLALAWLWVGLVTSISQSSMVALLLGLAVLAAWRWNPRYVGGAVAVLLAVGVVFLLAAPSSLHFGVKGSGGSLNNASSGRVKLVEGGVKLFAKRPIEGFGSGSFAQEYRSREVSTAASATSASHTTPITIAAEQGILGVVLYVALLIVAFVQLCLGAGRSPPRIAIVACFAALVLHTMAYADFLEDPTSWALLGIGLALAAASRRERAAGERDADALAAA